MRHVGLAVLKPYAKVEAMPYIAQASIFLLLLTVSAMAQPTIGGIVNAGSYATAPLDANSNPIGSNNIAQGSYFVIFGAGMGPASIVVAPGLPLQTSLPDANGTSISISTGGQTVNAYLYYTAAGQVSAILPSNTPVGPANVTVAYNGQTSKPVAINVVKSQLGLFTQNSQGNGPTVAQVFSGSTNFRMGLTNPAHPGDTVVIVGTGLGGISGPDNDVPGAVPVGSNVTVTIGGIITPATYAGRAPQFPGEDQINFVVPSNVPVGCYVPASVTASGQVSQDVVLSIAAAGSSACLHPFGLSQSALATLDGGGTVNVGFFQALTAFVAQVGGQIQGAGGLFDNVNANGVFQMYNRIPVAFGVISYPAPLNSCVVIDQLNTGAGFTVPNFSTIGGTELIADPLLMTMSGPGGSANVLHQDTGGYLGVFLPPILGPGSWTLSSNGGADVGAFNAKVTLPDNLIWTNGGNFMSLPVPRSDQGITILWSGGNLSASSVVTVFGNSTVVNVKDPSLTRGKSFYCAAPASAGKFVVPGSVVLQIPSSATASGETAYGALGITTGGLGNFTASLTKGTLDAGVMAYGEAYVLGVKYAQ
jgi:uncharacterized protein (TIGR03437 family)